MTIILDQVDLKLKKCQSLIIVEQKKKNYIYEPRSVKTCLNDI